MLYCRIGVELGSSLATVGALASAGNWARIALTFRSISTELSLAALSVKAIKTPEKPSMDDDWISRCRSYSPRRPRSCASPARRPPEGQLPDTPSSHTRTESPALATDPDQADCTIRV